MTRIATLLAKTKSVNEAFSLRNLRQVVSGDTHNLWKNEYCDLIVSDKDGSKIVDQMSTVVSDMDLANKFAEEIARDYFPEQASAVEKEIKSMLVLNEG